MTLTERQTETEIGAIETSRPLVLASASPRRADLLRSAGIEFDVFASEVDESAISGSSPADTAKSLALAKARSVAAKRYSVAVLAADTVVALDGVELGKPADAAEATGMLRKLSGQAHTVYTSIAVIVDGEEWADVVATEVNFRSLSDDEIGRYVASGSPMDKAGGYGIQDSDFAPVESFVGSYTNVVGLPLAATGELLAVAGVISDRSAARMKARES